MRKNGTGFFAALVLVGFPLGNARAAASTATDLAKAACPYHYQESVSSGDLKGFTNAQPYSTYAEYKSVVDRMIWAVGNLDQPQPRGVIFACSKAQPHLAQDEADFTARMQAIQTKLDAWKNNLPQNQDTNGQASIPAALAEEGRAIKSDLASLQTEFQQRLGKVQGVQKFLTYYKTAYDSNGDLTKPNADGTPKYPAINMSSMDVRNNLLTTSDSYTGSKLTDVDKGLYDEIGSVLGKVSTLQANLSKHLDDVSAAIKGIDTQCGPIADNVSNMKSIQVDPKGHYALEDKTDKQLNQAQLKQAENPATRAAINTVLDACPDSLKIDPSLKGQGCIYGLQNAMADAEGNLAGGEASGSVAYTKRDGEIGSRTRGSFANLLENPDRRAELQSQLAQYGFKNVNLDAIASAYSASAGNAPAVVNVSFVAPSEAAAVAANPLDPLFPASMSEEGAGLNEARTNANRAPASDPLPVSYKTKEACVLDGDGASYVCVQQADKTFRQQTKNY